jgi:hypothetical protein
MTKVRENQARRLAAQQGLTLRKSRRRDPRALDFGTYTLLNEKWWHVGGQAMTLEQVEDYLSR